MLEILQCREKCAVIKPKQPFPAKTETHTDTVRISGKFCCSDHLELLRILSSVLMSSSPPLNPAEGIAKPFASVCPASAEAG